MLTLYGQRVLLKTITNYKDIIPGYKDQFLRETEGYPVLDYLSQLATETLTFKHLCGLIQQTQKSGRERKLYSEKYK